MFWPPVFLGGGPSNFWTWIKFRQFPTMWPSFTAIGRGTSENAWRKNEERKKTSRAFYKSSRYYVRAAYKEDTSRVKHKPVRNYRSGRPKYHLYSHYCGVYNHNGPRIQKRWWRPVVLLSAFVCLSPTGLYLLLLFHCRTRAPYLYRCV